MEEYKKTQEWNSFKNTCIGIIKKFYFLSRYIIKHLMPIIIVFATLSLILFYSGIPYFVFNFTITKTYLLIALSILILLAHYFFVKEKYWQPITIFYLAIRVVFIGVFVFVNYNILKTYSSIELFAAFGLLFVLFSDILYFRLFYYIKRCAYLRFPYHTNAYDNYGWYQSIQTESLKIKKVAENGFVSVIKLTGGQGSGKSFFARKLIEFLLKDGVYDGIELTHNRSQYLYSYISLTEVNDSKDFSSLFNERWDETLSSHYPIFSKYNALFSILRTADGKLANIYSSLIGVLYSVSYFLFVYKDIFSKEAKEAFHYLTSFKHKQWIIVIDEIDRAKYDDILNLIHVIERFKLQYYEKAPIHITFLLVLDDTKLPRSTEGDRTRDIIANFFGGDSEKTFNFVMSTPPATEQQRKSIVYNYMHELFPKHYQGVMPNLYKGSDWVSASDPAGVAFTLWVNLVLRQIHQLVGAIRICNMLDSALYSPESIIMMEYAKLRFGNVFIECAKHFAQDGRNPCTNSTNVSAKLLKQIEEENKMSNGEFSYFVQKLFSDGGYSFQNNPALVSRYLEGHTN